MNRRFTAIICIAILYIFQGCATEYSRKKIVADAESYLQRGKTDRAYYEFERALDDHPEDIELHKEFIRFVSRIHRCEEASKYYNSSRFEDGKLRHIYFYARALLGISCFLKDKKEVLGDFEEALRLAPENTEVRMRYAVVLTEYEMYKEAYTEFSKLSWKINDSPSLYSYIALCSAHLGDRETVRKSVKQMLSLGFSPQDLKRANESLDIINSHCLDVPDDIREEFRKTFDMILMEENPSQAKNAIENFIVKYPGVPALHLVKSLSLALTGEYSSALYELNSVEMASGSCSYFQYAGGIIYLGVQKEEKGILLLERAVEYDPLFGSAYRILSELYLAKKEYVKASDALRIYLKLSPDDHKSRFIYGRTLLKLGRISEAKSEFDYIAGKEPDNIFGIIGKGLTEKAYARVSKDKKKREEHIKRSLEYLNSAIKRDPENENIRTLIQSINSEED